MESFYLQKELRKYNSPSSNIEGLLKGLRDMWIESVFNLGVTIKWIRY
jgi:hypothetical protein